MINIRKWLGNVPVNLIKSVCLLLWGMVVLFSMGDDVLGGEIVSARELVKDSLLRSGIRIGCDSERQSVVVIEQYRFDWNGRTTEGKDFLEQRELAFEKAYLRAVGDIASKISCEVSHVGQSVQKTLTSVCRQNLLGVSILMQAEAMTTNRVFECAVAVVWSKKLEDRIKRALAGESCSAERPGRYSVEEWVERNDLTNFWGTRNLTDNTGRQWVLSVAALDATESGPNDEMLLKIRCAYYLETAIQCKVIGVQSIMTDSRKGADFTSEKVGNHMYGSMYRRESENFYYNVALMPAIRFLPTDGRIQWYYKSAVHPISGQKVRIAVGAFPLDALKGAKGLRVRSFEDGRNEVLDELRRQFGREFTEKFLENEKIYREQQNKSKMPSSSKNDD